jgi:PAS domain S-box-containing protein
MSRKYSINSLLPWIIPFSLFLIFLIGHLIMLSSSRSLIYEYVKNQSMYSAREINIRFHLLLYERAKDLAHLASLWSRYSPQTASSLFLTDAAGIASRESTYYSIDYIDTIGRTLSHAPSDVPEITKNLDSKHYLSCLAYTKKPLLSNPLRFNNRYRIVLFYPVFKKSGIDSVFIGTVAATLRIREIIPSIISASTPSGFHLKLKIDTTTVYETDSIGTKYLNQSTAYLSVSDYGQQFTITVFPPQHGDLDNLLAQSWLRFLMNILASFLAAVLLSVTMNAIYKSRITGAELEKSEQRFRRLAENARDMIFRITLPEGKFEYVSPAASLLTGYSQEEFYSEPLFFRKYVDPQWHQIVMDHFSKAVKGDISPVIEYRIISKSGEIRWVSQRNVTVFDQNGNPIAFEGIVTDITDQKKAMADRERLIIELERKNADLERFTYTISHELKTPLITIKGFLGYIEEEAAKGDIFQMHQDILRIISATETMQRLLNDLIELSKVGTFSRIQEDINTVELVKKATERFSERIKTGNISLIISENMPDIKGYYRELLELFQNLIENSIKFMGNQPKPEIRIGSGVLNGETFFFISDNGIGIESRYRERIFGLFNKLSPISEGTGVGLTLVKRIIDLHGGWIRMESQGSGQGTTFFFRLPLSE